MAMDLIILGDQDLTNLNLEKVVALVERMKAHPSRVDVPVIHRFSDGIYIREVHVPAGTAIVTMMHRVEHPFVLSMGSVLVYPLGGAPVCLNAPHTGITKPGTLRLVVTLTDVVWTTFHATKETDIEKLEKELVLSPREALELGY